MTPTATRPVSPCIRACQLDEATQCCRGCRRTLDEIVRWGGMTEAEKAAVWRRLEAGARDATD
ncbi:DUF1289 domain-containing protein [Halomonas sp. 328]|uniref:DUF1289 domain-containing protein n=1 Tax=Halomonas sp. 328 TaxID=2776704 RepID=UPI0018A79EC3|nr:DUF1289 domain-containing protein [Halomonas sp. 328]MBF8221929.1 DUF1289 domain-containing protein [Halomonas sp. 328]